MSWIFHKTTTQKILQFLIERNSKRRKEITNPLVFQLPFVFKCYKVIFIPEECSLEGEASDSRKNKTIV
jgi:hypothetical protein